MQDYSHNNVMTAIYSIILCVACREQQASSTHWISEPTGRMSCPGFAALSTRMRFCCCCCCCPPAAALLSAGVTTSVSSTCITASAPGGTGAPEPRAVAAEQRSQPPGSGTMIKWHDDHDAVGLQDLHTLTGFDEASFIQLQIS